MDPETLKRLMAARGSVSAVPSSTAIAPRLTGRINEPINYNDLNDPLVNTAYEIANTSKELYPKPKHWNQELKNIVNSIAEINQKYGGNKINLLPSKERSYQQDGTINLDKASEWNDYYRRHENPSITDEDVVALKESGMGKDEIKKYIDEAYYFKGRPDVFFQELAHAKQFAENPITSHFRAAYGQIAHEDSMDPITGRYGIEGALENEAHSSIAPDLWKEFKNIYKRRTGNDIPDSYENSFANAEGRMYRKGKITIPVPTSDAIATASTTSVARSTDPVLMNKGVSPVNTSEGYKSQLPTLAGNENFGANITSKLSPVTERVQATPQQQMDLARINAFRQRMGTPIGLQGIK